MQTVYVDLLFLINFCMDFLCMVAISGITSRRLSYIRAFIGAVIGGLYSVTALFMPPIGKLEIIPALLCCLLMCLVVFAKTDSKPTEILSLTVTYLFTSAVLGGIMTATFNLLNSYRLDLNGSQSNDIPAWLLISVGIFSLLSTYLGGKILRRRLLRKSASVTVNFDKKSITFSAMYDSGNLLSDSISGRPVIVADKRHSKELLGFEINTDTALNATDEKILHRLVFVPYTTASGQKLMTAFRPDKIEISAKNHNREVAALIGFADVSCVEGCTALIPPEL